MCVVVETDMAVQINLVVFNTESATIVVSETFFILFLISIYLH